jgi:hypothetical protein
MLQGVGSRNRLKPENPCTAIPELLLWQKHVLCANELKTTEAPTYFIDLLVFNIRRFRKRLLPFNSEYFVLHSLSKNLEI